MESEAKIISEISDLIIFNAVPIYIGQEFKGYFLDREGFKEILNLLAEMEREENEQE